MCSPVGSADTQLGGRSLGVTLPRFGAVGFGPCIACDSRQCQCLVVLREAGIRRMWELCFLQVQKSLVRVVANCEDDPDRNLVLGKPHNLTLNSKKALDRS